jgi:hypothetical protein
MMTQLQILLSFYTGAGQLFDDFYQGREVNTDLLRKVILEL